MRRGWPRLVLQLLLRPWLWPAALARLRSFVPDGWWRRRPFLPLPDRDLIRFRATTMYGDEQAVPAPDDVITWLRWCQAEARRDRAGRRR